MKTFDAFETKRDRSGHRFGALTSRRGVCAGATFPGEEEGIA
jgi:hypothetical protein